MNTPPSDLVSFVRLGKIADYRSVLAADVTTGLTAEQKWLPAKYLYDARGSELFEEITELEEYYPTRCEAAILEQYAPELLAQTKPTELIELGSGSSSKTRMLIEAMHAVGGTRYVPFDVSSDALQGAADILSAAYPWLEIVCCLGDFNRHMDRIPRSGPRLVAFLGSTIGNFRPEDRVPFLRRVRSVLKPGDHFLLGTDLVKDRDVLVAAYDDARGVTAAFNKNVLSVLNRELEGDFPLDAFEHRAYFNEEAERIEMRLKATRGLRVRLAAIELEVEFQPGEEFLTEISSKFRRPVVEAMLGDAGLRHESWLTDPKGYFALSLATLA